MKHPWVCICVVGVVQPRGWEGDCKVLTGKGSNLNTPGRQVASLSVTERHSGNTGEVGN